MLFVILARDKPDGHALRAATRPAHLGYVAGAGDRLKLGGPIRDGEGRPVGSLLIIDAASETAARLFAQNDPYAEAGLFGQVEILPFAAVAGQWNPAEGG